jgi:endonuclease-8
MPEGHTVHRLAQDLTATLGGGPVEASSPQGRFEAGAALISGEPLVRSEAFGKYLFCEFGAGGLLHVHLGLIGKFRPHDPSATAGNTVRLRLENDAVAWHLTGPARCELITPAERKAIVAGLGVDPLRPRQDVARFRGALAATSKPIGAVLLDQRVIAGIGNVYRAEILFLCGIDPQRPASSLTDDEVASVWDEARRLLRRGRRMNRIVTTEPAEVGRALSKIEGDDRLHVYHREYCRRCAGSLRTVELGGRPLQFCPACQPS